MMRQVYRSIERRRCCPRRAENARNRRRQRYYARGRTIRPTATRHPPVSTSPTPPNVEAKDGAISPRQRIGTPTTAAMIPQRQIMTRMTPPIASTIARTSLVRRRPEGKDAGHCRWKRSSRARATSKPHRFGVSTPSRFDPIAGCGIHTGDTPRTQGSRDVRPAASSSRWLSRSRPSAFAACGRSSDPLPRGAPAARHSEGSGRPALSSVR